MWGREVYGKNILEHRKIGSVATEREQRKYKTNSMICMCTQFMGANF